MTKKKSDHPNRDKIILKLAKLHGIAAASYEALPSFIIEFYEHYKYIELIRPLLTIDRQNGKSYGALAIKYGVTKRTVEYHFCCAARFVISEEEE